MGEHTNEHTYVLTYIRTGQTLYPLHNFVVRGDNQWFQVSQYPSTLGYMTELFSFQNNQKSRSILYNGSTCRSLGLFRKGKTCIIANFHRIDVVICSHSSGRKTLTYKRINKVPPS